MAVTDAPLPNPNDNVSRLVYIPSAIFVVICPIVVALRVWARLRSGKMGPDDWTAIAALVSISGPDWEHAILTIEHFLWLRYLHS